VPFKAKLRLWKPENNVLALEVQLRYLCIYSMIDQSCLTSTNSGYAEFEKRDIKTPE
jgi:hypothetical protein